MSVYQGKDNELISYLEQIIGNAVPVKLAEYVANAILDYFSKSNIVEKLGLKPRPFRDGF
jgi:hypothetical protein